MKSSCKRVTQCSAMTWIGLAATAVALFAQPASAAPAFTCPVGEWVGLVIQGRNDKFAGQTELTAPSAAVLAYPGFSLNGATNLYDQAGSNNQFADTLPVINPPAFPTVTSARVTMRMRPNSSGSNDGVSFSSFGWPAQTSPVVAEGARFGFGMTTLPNAGSWAPPQKPVVFRFDFVPTGNVVTVYGGNSPGSALAGGYDGPTFFAALNANKRLDVFTQDDTGVDFVQLEICAQI